MPDVAIGYAFTQHSEKVANNHLQGYSSQSANVAYRAFRGHFKASGDVLVDRIRRLTASLRYLR